MSSTGGGDIHHGKVLVLHTASQASPVSVSVQDLIDWMNSLDAANPLKDVLATYIASIPES